MEKRGEKKKEEKKKGSYDFKPRPVLLQKQNLLEKSIYMRTSFFVLSF